MKFVGLLLLDILLIGALFFISSESLKEKSVASIIAVFIVGLCITYVWSLGVYFSLMLIIKG